MKPEPQPSPEKLIDLLFSGLVERPTWRTFLSGLAGLIGGRESTFIIISRRRQIDENVVIGCSTADDARLQEIIRFLSKDTMPFDTPIFLEGVEEDIGEWHSAAGVRLHLDADRSIYLFTRPGDDPVQMAELWRNAFRTLHPYLSQIVKHYLMIGDWHRRLLTAEYVLQASGTGVVLVDMHGAIINMSDTAKTFIENCGVLKITDGHLHATRRSEQTELLKLIGKKAEQQSPYIDIDCYETIALSRDDDPLPLTVIVRPGPPYAPASAPLRRTATIILRDPSRRLKMATLQLERLFELSRAEARLAGLLAEGLSLEEAAICLNVSRHTVRTQLRAIFIKTGTNRQGDLVRILLSSVAALAQGASPT